MLGDSTTLAGNGTARSEQLVPAAITDIGCEREINEDRYAVIDCPSGRSWVVCDGMGGVVGGELAAQLAIDAIRRGLESREFDDSEEALRFAVEQANRIIVLRRQNPTFSSMGTTVVAAIVQDNELVLLHAGDSRAYLVRDGEIEQLTVDHTYVQDLVDKGMISEEEAMTHPQAHVLTRCLGADPRLQLDTKRYWIWEREEPAKLDYLVLCSDGLYSHVSNDEIAKSVATHTPQESCVDLVELAKERGGYDNITIAVLPIAGELRDESPVGHISQSERARLRKAMPLERPRLPLGKRLALMFVLFLLGSLVSMLAILVS